MNQFNYVAFKSDQWQTSLHKVLILSVRQFTVRVLPATFKPQTYPALHQSD